jgi:hypothetical protein
MVVRPVLSPHDVVVDNIVDNARNPMSQIAILVAEATYQNSFESAAGMSHHSRKSDSIEAAHSNS